MLSLGASHLYIRCILHYTTYIILCIIYYILLLALEVEITTCYQYASKGMLGKIGKLYPGNQIQGLLTSTREQLEANPIARAFFT